MSITMRKLAEGSPPPAGRYGPYGGRFAPETLMSVLQSLEQRALELLAEPSFRTSSRGRAEGTSWEDRHR